MKFIATLIFCVFSLGCSNSAFIRLGENGHQIQILDNLTRSEGEMVASYISSKMNELRSEYISVDAKFTHLVSISKWHTPGMQTEDDKKCKYSANFHYGGFGNQVCIGGNKMSGQGIQLKVLWSTSWIS